MKTAPPVLDRGAVFVVSGSISRLFFHYLYCFVAIFD